MDPSKTSPAVSFTVDAKPYAYTFPRAQTALVIIDMQRDFLLPGGFGEAQGTDLTAVQASIEPTRKLLDTCRGAGLAIFHTREGHKPDLSDLPSTKVIRQAAAPGNTQYKLVIGDEGKMGRLLVRGEYGHDFVDELRPRPGEVVIDKPGKGAFFDTTLMHKLKARSITHLLISGVTTECCVATTFREANDRGFECCAVTEATAGYNACFKTSSLDMLHWSQGLFGFVTALQPILDALTASSPGRSLSGHGTAETPPQTPPEWDGDLHIPNLRAAYAAGLSPVSVVESLYAKIESYEKVNPGVWIHLVSKSDILAAAQELATAYPDKSALPPLYGAPFTVKDSIDIAGLRTTTACPPLTRVAATSAPIYDSVISAGALFLGKVNLDQLATGLTGQRSPYGTLFSAFHPDFISGGSSSGSAVSVGAGLASFSLATDTAGSGRVPAAFNGVVGYKPTRGTVPFVGITPACLSLDCVAVTALDVSDARSVWQTLEARDAHDPYAKPSIRPSRHVNATGPQASRFRFGVPPPEALECCTPAYRRLFLEAISKLQRMGGELRPLDWTPFQQAGDLLYDGSFVCERLASLPGDGDPSSSDTTTTSAPDPAAWVARHRDALHPVILAILEAVLARNTTAAQVFRDLQTQARLTALVRNEVFTLDEARGVDVVVVPTAPTHWTLDEVRADPIRRNSHLGTFTHSGNVLDLCAVACPAGTVDAREVCPVAGEGTLPFGVTFLGGSGLDCEVLEIARRFGEAA